MIKQTTAQLVLEAALSTGGDFAELYMEDGTSNSIMMLDGKIETASTSRSCGAGVRVFSGFRSAYSYTADTSDEALIGAAKAAAAAIKDDKAPQIVPFVKYDGSASPKIPFSTVDNAAKIAKLTEAYKAAKEYSDELKQIIVTCADVDKNVFVCNTEGVWAYDRRPRIRFVTQAVASDGTDTQTGFNGPGYAMGFEVFENKIDPAFVGRDAARQAVTMLHAVDCPAGVYPVVIDNGFGGVIFHEACGHALEATSVSKGNSVFCGKMGQKIAADCVSAVDNGVMPGEWGTIGIDDEGTPSRSRQLIKDGILTEYMVDRLGGRRMNMAPTGSSRRQDYSYAPTSRMTNTFICAGKDDNEEMIRTMGTGLFAASMGGGSVNPLTGEFNFAVNEGYWVKDGKIVTPVRGATLIGKGADILMKIDRVGTDMQMAAGMCGSVSGSVATNVGQPRIRVTDITVGGKGGAI